MIKLFNYRRHGGLHFITIGRFGMSWYVKRWKPTVKRPVVELTGWSDTVVDHLYTSYVD